MFAVTIIAATITSAAKTNDNSKVIGKKNKKLGRFILNPPTPPVMISAFLKTSCKISDRPRVMIARYIPSILSEINPTAEPINIAIATETTKAINGGNFKELIKKPTE